MKVEGIQCEPNGVVIDRQVQAEGTTLAVVFIISSITVSTYGSRTDAGDHVRTMLFGAVVLGIVLFD